MAEMHEGHRERLKARFRAESLEHFDDLQVLELLLFYAIPRRDTNPVAHALLDRFGSLSGVLEAREEDLAAVPGVGENAALLLAMIPQLTRRYLRDVGEGGCVLGTTEACGKYLLPYFLGAQEERVYLLCLDAKCKVLGCFLLHKGSVNAAAVSVRKVADAAIRSNASSVVLAHNHTSGVALPSEEDRNTTYAVYHALAAIGVRLADHIIMASGDFVSLADDGFFRKLEDGWKPLT